MDRLVDIKDLGLTIGGQDRVANVDIDVAPGSVTGLVGPNGAGKTTILRLLAGLSRPSAGAGHVLGRDIRAGRHAGGEAPGYMPQSASIQSDLSVGELLHYRAILNGVARPSATIMATMEELGLTQLARRRIATLSGGWQRRVDLAAALIADPRLLLLDEPTTGLDQDARAAIWAHITIVAARGAGVIVNTHDLAEAERCDALILMIDGGVAARGTPAALIAATGATRLEDAWPLLVSRA